MYPRPIASLALASALMLSSACSISNHAQESVTLNPVPRALDINAPGPVVVTTVVSAIAPTPLNGLLNLDSAAAKEAGLGKEEIQVQLVVHVLEHPEAGTFIIDTGVNKELAEGGKGGVTWLMRKGFPVPEVPATLADIIEDKGGEIDGVLLTHIHPDHVLGLPDLPLDTPIYMGNKELDSHLKGSALTRRTYNMLFKGRIPVKAVSFEGASALGPVERAVDLLGDGSIILLDMPGHTPSSLAFLVRSTEGPMLMVGDTSHTWWGWEHGVEPGGFSEDQAENLKRINELKALVDANPEIKVWVGHETDGRGTGVDPEALAPWAQP